ncbi:hypothetical protein J4E85_006552 [Alternaria conjuncta]|uniref:uncharacterized protein n=1 Tax=Alternaria conjuncta TaxID=181017 RepID=UPI002220717F|nr:uncharacterized protein J4E85_006552 [Alternaria conjuncta]KAI4926260.1 hypothetical protein J4E85_006552 [Alternaria conjuncta]
MASEPTSLIECFDQELPTLDAHPMPYKSAKPSGESTRLAVPPLILRHVSWKQFSALADNTLSSLTNNPQSENSISTTFSQLPLQSESDVVYASLLYVVQPIMEILQVLYPNQWTTHTELHDKASEKRESLEDPKTKVTKDVISYDLVFKSTTQHPNPGKTIAVIEYKRRELIRHNDFQDAIIPDSSTPAQINKLKKQSLDMGDQGLLKSNALSYCKQVSRYAQISKCKHVALFNWQHLLLFDFHQLSASMNGSFKNKPNTFAAGDEAKISWVCEGAPPVPFMEQGFIRKVLLGWIIRAFEDSRNQ